MRQLRRIVLVAATLTACPRSHDVPEPASTRGGLELTAYYGSYQLEGKRRGHPAARLVERREVWDWDAVSLEGRDGQPRLGVLFPNHEGADPYWRAVRSGIFAQADALGIGIELCASDGYTELAQHREQLDYLIERGVDGVLLGSIHYLAMDALVADITAKNIPVVAIINDIQAPMISAKALVSFYDMGARAGEFVLADAQAQEESEIVVALFPGPINAGWAPDSLEGFLDEIVDFDAELTVLPPQWGSPDVATQRALLVETLETHPRIDYIVGNAVAAKIATELLLAMGREEEVEVVSTYYSDALRELVASEAVAAAPSDRTTELGRLGVGMMARVLGGEQPGQDLPFRAGPEIPLVTKDSLEALLPAAKVPARDPHYERSGCFSHAARVDDPDAPR